LRFNTEDRLRTLEYRTTPATRFRVERKGEAWHAAKETAPIDTRVVAVGGVIDSSLYEAVKRTGESTALVGFFVDMFAWDINFYLDTQSGDRFKIEVEKLFLDGKFYKYGRVLAAEYAGRVGTFRAFWFEPPAGGDLGDGAGHGGYYNDRGESIVKSLLKTPLKYVRISSSFDRHRFHPILHTERAHLGVDYAAPTGTPVWATAGGRVTFRGPRGGAGNCVMVAHPGGMESIYMHLSKFAKGLDVGESVRQKQVIGYVGMTGLATGPHLHFSVKMGGHFVDPLRLKPAREAPLPPKYREAFRVAVAPRIESLAKFDVRASRAEPRSPTQPE
jgi:murein DD-endopeptidase MepM/ murein hydrolase activator NlpD